MMKILIERQTELTKDEWLEALEMSPAEWQTLNDQRILCPRSKKYYLNFVGLIATERSCIVSIPKYYGGVCSTVVQSDAIETVLKVLETYFAEGRGRAVRSQELQELFFQDETPLKEREVAETLLRWYAANGLYRHEERGVSTSFQGRTDWTRTLSRSQPVHSASGDVYATPFQQTRLKQTNEVTNIQASVLVHLSEKYRLVGTNVSTNSDITLFANIQPELLRKEAARFASIVNRELRSVFRSDTIQMLLALKAFLENLQGLGGVAALHLYGTSSFHVLWERACSVAFGNQADELAARLSQPKWHFNASKLTGRSHVYDGGRQIPDVITTVGRKYLILDAKYYYPLPSDRCGWEDIVKQLFYRESLETASMKVLNGLLFPALSEPSISRPARIFMSRNGLPDKRYRHIDVYIVNPRKVFEAYLSKCPRQDWRICLGKTKFTALPTT
jgi:hypothetical protein